MELLLLQVNVHLTSNKWFKQAKDRRITPQHIMEFMFFSLQGTAVLVQPNQLDKRVSRLGLDLDTLLLYVVSTVTWSSRKGVMTL